MKRDEARRWTGAFFFTGLLLLKSGVGWGQASDSTSDSGGGQGAGTEERFAELATKIDRLRDNADIPGLSVALVRDKELVWQGAFGVRDLLDGDAVASDTVFEGASLSKPIFAYAVLRLVKRGGLDLDTPLWEILPHDRLLDDPRGKKITARMVLCHRTGLPNWGRDSLEIQFEPGAGWGYSGEGYVYLQKCVAELTKLSTEEFVVREVFGPLSMEASSLVWRTEYDSVGATGHSRTSRPKRKFKPSKANAAGSLHTTAQDYARFLVAILEGKDEAARMTMKRQTEVTSWGTPESRANLAWGLGWGLQGEDDVIWHWGDNGVFRCFAMASRAKGDGFVYFTNSQNGHEILDEMIRLLLPGAEEGGVADWLER